MFLIKMALAMIILKKNNENWIGNHSVLVFINWHKIRLNQSVIN